tara:strand:+ start:122 stop:472 length:351 start_codon:yes stop_codon:yes gene_type:complete
MIQILSLETYTLLLSVIASATAHVMLKIGAASLRQISFVDIFNPWLMVGVFLHGLALFLWIFTLRTVDISKAYPFLALGYVIVAIAGHFFLGERFTVANLAGTLIICFGLFLVVHK